MGSVTISSHSAASFLVAVLFSVGAACGAEQPSVVSAPVIAVPTAATSAEPAAINADHCVLHARARMCKTKLGDEQTATLDERIAATQKRILDARYQDAPALVEIARLQLVRDRDSKRKLAQPEAKLNAMRALAVDPGLEAGKLAFALSLARELERAVAPELRPFSARLLSLATTPASREPGALGAAANAFVGFQHLMQGDAALAQAAFDKALKRHGSSAAALVGKGDVARHNGAFDDAMSFYERAAVRLGDHSYLNDRIAAAKTRRKLLLPRPGSVVDLPLATTATAPKVLPNAPCDAATSAMAESKLLCAGLLDSAHAKSDVAAMKSAALEIAGGWKLMRPLCRRGDPQCGVVVTRALITGARLFRATGQVAKAVSLLRSLALPNGEPPGGKKWATRVWQELGDLYMSMGIFHLATRYFIKAATQLGSQRRTRAAVNALALSVATVQPKEANDALRILRQEKPRAAQLVKWSFAVALTAPPAAGSERSWLLMHAAKLDKAGLSTRASALRLRASDRLGCEPALMCAHRLIARDSTWSSAATQ